MNPGVIVHLECLGVKGVVSHNSDDDLLYCDAEYDNEKLVTYGKTFDELVSNFQELVTLHSNEYAAGRVIRLEEGLRKILIGEYPSGKLTWVDFNLPENEARFQRALTLLTNEPAIIGSERKTHMETGFGYVDIGTEPLQLGELLVTDDGVEVEVVSLSPLRFEQAPEEAEDWGE